MISAALKDKHLYDFLLSQPIWQESFAWLMQNQDTTTEGIHIIDSAVGDDWFANVHSYQTKPQHDCTWENHQHTIDIQFLHNGIETIQWANRDLLGTPTAYLPEFDREEFAPVDCHFSLLTLNPRSFVVFQPGEAHRPMIACGTTTRLLKTVIKIPKRLLTCP